MQKTDLPPHDTSYSKRRGCSSLEAEYTDYVNLLKSGLTTEQAVVKIKRSKPPPTGTDTYQHLQKIWKQEKMSSFKDILRWSNKKDVVPTLQAMQKMIVFLPRQKHWYDEAWFYFTKPGRHCLNKSTDAKLHVFTEGGRKLVKKTPAEVIDGPSIVFERKAVANETFIRKSTNKCKENVGIDANELYLYSMCQTMPIGLYLRWDPVSVTSQFTLWQNKTRRFENMVMSYFQRIRPECEIERFFTTGRQKKSDCLSVDGFFLIATLSLKPWVVFTTSVPLKSCVLLSLKEIFNVVARRESSMHWDDTIDNRNATRLLECGSATGGDCAKQPILLNNISKNTFLTGAHL